MTTYVEQDWIMGNSFTTEATACNGALHLTTNLGFQSIKLKGDFLSM